MRIVRNAGEFRRLAVGLSLIAAPLVGLIGSLIRPQYTGDLAAELAIVAADPSRWMLSEFLTLLSFFLFLPALVGLMRLLRGGWTIPGYVGGGLAMLGAYVHGAIVGFALVEVPLVASGMEQTRMVAFVEQIYEHDAFSMLLAPFLGFFLGVTMLAVSLWRARVAPLWVSALIVVGLLSEFLGPESASPELMFVLLLAGFGWVARGFLGTGASRQGTRDAHEQHAVVRGERASYPA